MGRKICLNRSGMAAGMTGSDPVLRLRSRDPQDYLHHQCHRKFEPCDPQIHQDPRLVSDRRRRHKADLPGTRNFGKGGRNVREKFAARNPFAIVFDDRFNA